MIIDLAHRFRMTVVAEGIEDPQTLQALKAAGCDIAQGYLFGKAMPPKEFQSWLDKHDRKGIEALSI